MAEKSPSLAVQFATLRERVAMLETRRAALLSAWKSRPEVTTLVNRSIDAAAQRFAGKLQASLACTARPNGGEGFRLFQVEPDAGDIADFLAFLHADAIKTAAARITGSMPWKGEELNLNSLGAVELDLAESRLALAELQQEISNVLA